MGKKTANDQRGYEQNQKSSNKTNRRHTDGVRQKSLHIRMKHAGHNEGRNPACQRQGLAYETPHQADYAGYENNRQDYPINPKETLHWPASLGNQNRGRILTKKRQLENGALPVYLRLIAHHQRLHPQQLLHLLL